MDKNYYENLPRKAMGAGVLLFNQKEELLIVKPGYKDGWIIPGGVIEKNESPTQAALRETNEELGLILVAKTLRFLSVAYFLNNDNTESLQFTFYGGILNDEQTLAIRIDGEEIIDYKFLPVEMALILLRENLRFRIEKSMKVIKKGGSVFLEKMF